MELRKFLIPEFVTGTGAIKLAGHYAQNLGGGKVLIVTDKGIIEAGWVSKVVQSLKKLAIPYEIYDNVTPNPKDNEVMQGADLFKTKNCKVILAVGGGSPIDCAKGIAIVSTNHKNILEFEGVDKVEIPMPPLICIPTTAGTSADISQFAIISDTKRLLKIAIISKAIVPDISLIDPQTNLTKPDALTAATGMDALVHAIEAYVSNASSCVTDLHAIEAIKLISSNLLKAMQKPQELIYREKMMLGSLLAGLAFSNASLGLVHGMAHSLGGFNDSAHGECNSILLEHVIEFNFEAALNKYLTIASIFGVDVLNSQDIYNIRSKLITEIRSFREAIGIKFGLADFGIKKTDLQFLAQNALNDPCLLTNPKELTTEEIIKIYEAAF